MRTPYKAPKNIPLNTSIPEMEGEPTNQQYKRYEPEKTTPYKTPTPTPTPTPSTTTGPRIEPRKPKPKQERRTTTGPRIEPREKTPPPRQKAGDVKTEEAEREYEYTAPTSRPTPTPAKVPTRPADVRDILGTEPPGEKTETDTQTEEEAQQDTQTRTQQGREPQPTPRNFDELLDITAKMCNDAYDTSLAETDSLHFINVERSLNLDVPVLFQVINDTLFVAFRGTDPGEFTNVLTDLLTGATSQTGVKAVDERANTPNRLDTYDNLMKEINQDFSNIMFHLGFLRSMNRMYFDVYTEISKYANTVRSVVLTGHSYGGALASLFYYVYANRINLLDGLPRVSQTITYGAPRFLRQGYNELYLKNCPHLVRVVSVNDIIPYVPFAEELKTVLPVSIATGFTDVGEVICLQRAIDYVNVNEFVIDLLRGNLDKVDSLTQNMPAIEANELIQFMLSDKYLALVMGATVECARQCTPVKQTYKYSKGLGDNEMEVTHTLDQQQITYVQQQLKNNLAQISEYNEKCQLVKGYGLTEIFEANKIARDDSVIDWMISNITGFALGFTVRARDYHLMDTPGGYFELLAKLKIAEVKTQQDFKEAIKTQTAKVEKVQIKQPDVLGIITGDDWNNGDLIMFDE